MWVGGIPFIYTLHLGEMVNCFFFERVRKGLFHLPLLMVQGNTSLFNACHGHRHSFPPPRLPGFFPRTSVSFWPAPLKLVSLAALSFWFRMEQQRSERNISDPSLDQDQHIPATFPLADDSADPCWPNHTTIPQGKITVITRVLQWPSAASVVWFHHELSGLQSSYSLLTSHVPAMVSLVFPDCVRYVPASVLDCCHSCPLCLELFCLG